MNLTAGLVTVGALIAVTTPQQLASAWRSALERHGSYLSRQWSSLDADGWRAVAAGEIGKRRIDTPGGHDGIFVIGFIDQPMWAVWIGVLDGKHGSLVSDMVEALLPGTNETEKVLYQHLVLPFPLSDRHWVIRVRNNRPLYEASQGKLCERSWDLDHRGTGALADLPAELNKDLDDIIWTPVNDGGWLLVSVGDATLVAYTIRADIGGLIPRVLVTSLAMLKMDEMLEEVGRRADRVPFHYTGDHYLVYRPDGTAIERF